MIGTLLASVVARIKITCLGGSSRVFKSALAADLLSIWTSSIMYTLYLPYTGAMIAFSRSSRMLSTPVFEAASISIMSR